MTDFLDEYPERMHIVHLKSQDSASAQYNPTEVNEKLGSVWSRLKVMGSTSEELQWVQTKNLRISFTLKFDEKSATGIRVPDFAGRPAQLSQALPTKVRTSSAVAISRPSENVTITSRRGVTSQPGRTRLVRNFLMALQYPTRGAQTVRDGAPSRLLFVWPEMWRITCRLVGIDFGHSDFGISMMSARFSASLKLEVDSIGQRLTYEDVLEQGTIRHDASVQG